MDRALPTRSKRIREGFRGQLLVDPHPGDRIVVRRSRICLRKRVEYLSLRRSYREDLPSIVDRDRPNLHSRPSVSRSLIRSRSFLGATPTIGFLLSKSHFTTSLRFRYTWTCRVYMDVSRWMVTLPPDEDITTASKLSHA